MISCTTMYQKTLSRFICTYTYISSENSYRRKRHKLRGRFGKRALEELQCGQGCGYDQNTLYSSMKFSKQKMSNKYFFLKKYLFFFHTVHPDYCFSFLNFFELPPLISPLPQVHPLSLIIQKRTGTPGTLTEHSTTRYNKDQHKPS